MMLASKYGHEARRALVVLSAALILTVPALALALADPPQEGRVTTSDAATDSEGVVEGLGNPAANNRQASCDDEPLALGENEDGNTKDAVAQVGGAADTSCDPSAESVAGLSEAPKSEGLTGSEDEPPTQVGPMASSATSSIDSVSEFVSRAFSIIGASYQWSGYTWTGNPFSSAFTCSGVVDFARGMPSRSSSPETLSAEVGRRMVYDASQLSYGDLVFYESLGRAPGHVGIYIGNRQIIDSIPNGGVAVRDVMYMGEAFMGGGPIYTDSTERPSEGTPTLTNDGGHGTGTPADIDDETPGPTKGTDVMPDPVPTSAPTTMPVSRAASPAALPETGDPGASTIAAAFAVSGICGLLAGRRLRS